MVALNLAGVTTKAYAQQHGLSWHSLRHWISRFKADASMTDAPQLGAFVAVQLERSASALSPVASGSAPSGCTLRCAAGWELEMTELPAPQWLAGLAAALRQVR